MIVFICFGDTRNAFFWEEAIHFAEKKVLWCGVCLCLCKGRGVACARVCVCARSVCGVYKGTLAKGGWSGGMGPSWSVQMYFNSGKGEKGPNRAGEGLWSKTGGKKGGKGQEKGGKGDIRVCWSCGKTAHIEANCTKGSWNKSLNAVEEDKRDISEEVDEDEDELHAWCLRDGS